MDAHYNAAGPGGCMLTTMQQVLVDGCSLQCSRSWGMLTTKIQAEEAPSFRLMIGSLLRRPCTHGGQQGLAQPQGIQFK